MRRRDEIDVALGVGIAIGFVAGVISMLGFVIFR